MLTATFADQLSPPSASVKGEVEIEARLVLLQASPLLHQLDQVAAVHLHHLVHVHPGELECDEHLDDQGTVTAADPHPAAGLDIPLLR